MRNVIFIVAVILSACGATSNKKVEDKKFGVFMAVYQKGGVKKFGQILKAEQDSIVYDSVSKQKSVVSKPLCGVWVVEIAMDTVNKIPLKDHSGRDSLMAGSWRYINCDSVNFHIELVPVDTLLKR